MTVEPGSEGAPPAVQPELAREVPDEQGDLHEGSVPQTPWNEMIFNVLEGDVA
jgi:hypothetical protein